jgi:hypothetical protein
LRFSPVDPQHPNQVALMQGPLTLFAVGDVPSNLTRANLLATRQSSLNEWQLPTASQTLKMLPYAAITKETYRLYLPVAT